MLSSKNAMLAQSATSSLGLGDQLQAQVEADVNERKKKLMQLAGQNQGQQAYGPATQSLFNMTSGAG
jgi:hypothetical protein